MRYDNNLEGLDIQACNVLFVTLDSCRYDTTQMASLKTMTALGPIKKATTDATYTFPAHMSYFVGYLPSVYGGEESAYYSREIKQLWRLNTARYKDPKTVGILLQGDTILSGYRKLGYKIVGGGGAGWFNSTILTSLFDEFHFTGPFNHNNIWTTRHEEEFVSTHIDTIIKSVEQSDKWFVFLNCVETHAPYDTGNGISNELKDIFNKYKAAWGGRLHTAKKIGINYDVLREVHLQQAKALEVVDHRLGKLIEQLPKNRPVLVVICGDHGEGFGEDYVWGHGIAVDKVLEVPLVIGIVS